MQWVDEVALSRINASGRKGQRLSDQRKQPLSKDKTKLTWATADSNNGNQLVVVIITSATSNCYYYYFYE
eukprot:9221159-Pyramimonas_sp.AAC.1